MAEKREKKLRILREGATLFAGGLLFGAAYNMFLVPGGVFIGGAGGIATVLHVLYGLPTGLSILVINVPLVLLFLHYYGFAASIKGMAGIFVSSVFVDVTAWLGVFPPAFSNPSENTLLFALFGGILIGVAVGVMFCGGYTTGGSDLAALLIKLRWSGLPTAKVILAIDGAVVLFAAIATGSYTSVLYSFVAIFMSSGALEAVTGGFDKTRLAFIFTDRLEETANALMAELSRGVTLLDGMGWYTKEKKRVILCVVKKNEVYALKTLVRRIDPDAFMILADASETVGLGFKNGISDIAIEPKKKKTGQ